MECPIKITMVKRLQVSALILSCLVSVTGCLGGTSGSEDSSGINGENQELLEQRIAYLETALFEANASLEWKETEISILLTELENLGENIDGSLEAELVSLQSDYLNLSLYSFTANETISTLESQLSDEMDLREELYQKSLLRRVRDMSNSGLYGSQLDGADLSWTDLSYSNLGDSFLRQSNISNSNLSFSNLEWAYLMEANLSKSDFTGAYLYASNMQGANLESSVLSGAYVVAINLVDANLLHADLSDLDFNGVSWGNTICPDGTNSDDNGDTCQNNL